MKKFIKNWGVIILAWIVIIIAVFAIFKEARGDDKPKSMLQQCIIEEMEYWEDITLREARRNCLFLLRQGD